MADKSDVNKFISSKKRKRIFKKGLLILIVVAVGGGVFVTKAPIFNIKSIELDGVSKSDESKLKEDLSKFVGENIFTVNSHDIESVVKQNQYVKNVTITKTNFSSLNIAIENEAPVYYILNNGKYYIVNNELSILEVVDSIEGRDLVEIKGVVGEKSEVGAVYNNNTAYAKALEGFYPFISQNKEDIKLSYLDLTDIVGIKSQIGNVDIMFGDDIGIKDKMENVYRIMLSDQIDITSGYIDVSFDGPPVYKKTN